MAQLENIVCSGGSGKENWGLVVLITLVSYTTGTL
jgi:hypothetical protein